VCSSDLKKKIAQIEMQGNLSITSSAIKDEMGTKLIGSYCEDTCESIIQKIKKLYKDYGFLSADIKLEEKPLEKNEIKVTLIIKEGSPTIIKELNTEAEGFMSDEELKQRLNIKIGDRLSEPYIRDRIKDLRRYLHNNNYYSNVVYKSEINISKDTLSASIAIGIRTGPRFNITFEGNNTFTDPKILKGTLDITETDVLSREYYPALVKKIENYYKKYGFADVDADVKEDLGANKGELNLIFVIHEGAQKFFGKINFTVKDAKYRRQLRNYLEDNDPDFFSYRYFIKSEFEGLKDPIEQFFNEEGFIRARVIKVDFVPRGKNIVDVNYDIDVDEPTTIRELEVTGNTILKNEEIFKILSLKKGEMVKIPKLSEGIKKLIQTYRDQGYVDMSLDQEKLFSYSDDYRFVDMTVKINEGNKYKVGKIFINGLVKTNERVLTREMRVKEGDKVNLDLIQTSENAITGLSIFSSVSVMLLPTSEMGEGYRDILIKVEEKKAGLYEVGFGYRTDTGIRVATGVSYYNLNGWNRRISLSGSVSRKLGSSYRFMEYEIDGTYYEPYFLNIPFDLRINVGFKKEDLPDYGRRKLNIAFYFEKKLGNHYLILRNAFDRVNIFDATLIANNSTYWKYSLRPTYRYDNRDSVFNPTRGINFQVYGEWGHSLRSNDIVNYLKVVQLTKAYFTPIKNWMIVAGFDAGYIKGLNGGSILQDERFSLGGIDSIRGYRENIINDTTPVLPHQYFYTFTMELRRNLFWRLVGSVFHDIGTIYSQDPTVQGPFDSVGAGLSIRLPVGSISLQYGYIYSISKRIPPDRVGRLHFAIGTF
ncbi:MAG: BamA/TamA family outer membrane protein, partial [Proteobacteria bacterium]|nr:BamA/TamA family outer membrane protein [Pseudomonadota bacterium]